MLGAAAAGMVGGVMLDCWIYLHPDVKYSGATWWNQMCIPHRLLDLG